LLSPVLKTNAQKVWQTVLKSATDDLFTAKILLTHTVEQQYEA